MKQMDIDILFMTKALDEAKKAADCGEVPIGAIVVKGENIIGRGHNYTEKSLDISAHAEIIALKDAARTLSNWRMDECTLYVSAEPCVMCAGAIMNSRVKRVVYALPQPITGAAGSVCNVFAMNFPHVPIVKALVLEDKSKELLTDFFKECRNK